MRMSTAASARRFISTLEHNKGLQTLDLSHNMLGAWETKNVVEPETIRRTGADSLMPQYWYFVIDLIGSVVELHTRRLSGAVRCFLGYLCIPTKAGVGLQYLWG